MRQIVDSVLREKTTGCARRAAVLVVAAALVALAAPGHARAGGVPAELFAQAQANPAQVFDVIVQSASTSSTDTAGSTLNAMTEGERDALNKSLKDAVKAQEDAIKLAGKADDADGKVAKALEKVAEAQQKATEAAAQAAASGDPKDQEKAAKEQEKVAREQEKAREARAEADQAQAVALQAQQQIAAAQGALVAATDRARGGIRRQFQVIPAVSAQLTGKEILALQKDPGIVAVTANAPVASTMDNHQKWVGTIDAKWFWKSHERKDAAGWTPTIAIVDSGVDGSRVADFGGRLLTQVDLTSVGPNSPGDGRGHGTMVASLAAGGDEHHAGVDPDARLVSLDVINDNGEGRTADVIAACDWILQNRFAYNIRVANFSLHSATPSSFRYDPLAQAVERLWLNGIVVVAAAGNYASGGAASGVRYAPGSDPFVITVGAVDVNGNHNVKDDVTAPWSAWGYTFDGFAKPELAAPGRYMIAASPRASTLSQGGGQDPRLVGDGYLQLSGTSFAAPIVAGAAAAVLGLHPDWTPDLVKGALMLTANALPSAVPGSAGVGEIDVKDALRLKDVPPNPNLALNGFVTSGTLGPVFDPASWSEEAKRNASWSSASWSSASWSSASWSSASWSSAAEESFALTDNARADGYGEG